jgi:hypothetical protein
MYKAEEAPAAAVEQIRSAAEGVTVASIATT